MASILIKQVTLKGEKKDILIVDNIISKIDNSIDFKADEVISGTHMTAIPGLINMHTHAAMTLMRGYQEDLPLFEWLSKVWDLEDHLDPDMIYWGTKLACIEMIKAGITCFNDMYWYIDSGEKAVEETGMRSVLSYVFLDNGDSRKAETQRRECVDYFEKSKSWNPRNQFAVAIHGSYTVSEKNMLWATNFALDNNLLLHTHLSETQKENIDCMQQYRTSPTKRMKSLGILNDNVIAAHCVWVDDEDIEILGNRRVNVVHNVNSNLKLASGYKFKQRELRKAGANVTFGTDGAASSNNLDLLEAMKTTAILQKAWRNDPRALPLDEMMDMATLNAAKALRINAGKLEEGALADIVLVNTNSPAFTPNYNFLANLIYSAHSSCVDTVICDGKVIMRGGVVPGEQDVLDNANRVAEILISKNK